IDLIKYGSPLDIPQVKKTPLPAISHKKDSLTKSDKIMRFPSHILTSGTVC
ncbi:hypothetical protein Q604_UNBC15626G0001, partial [human gut metagenome]